MLKDYPVIYRFFVAIDYIIDREKLRGFKTFCDIYGFDRTVLNRLKKEPHRQFHPEWLSVIVIKCNISPTWLLTGKGVIEQERDVTTV